MLLVGLALLLPAARGDAGGTVGLTDHADWAVVADVGAWTLDRLEEVWNAWEDWFMRSGRERAGCTLGTGRADAVLTAWLPAELFSTHRPPVLRLASEPGEDA